MQANYSTVENTVHELRFPNNATTKFESVSRLFTCEIQQEFGNSYLGMIMAAQ